MRKLFVFATVLCTCFALVQGAVAQPTMQPISLSYKGCYANVSYSLEMASACITVGKPQDHFTKVEGNKVMTFEGYRLPPKAVEDRYFPAARASYVTVKPVYRRRVRRRVVHPHCRNCRFVPVANNPQAKAYARQWARFMGVSVPTQIVGFLVPWPFNIAASTLVCASLSVEHDAKEYREDYRQEPTQEQYNMSFGGNLVGCSPIGPLVSAQNPLQLMQALLGLSGYFIALPPGVLYAQQGLQMANWAEQRHRVQSKSAPAAPKRSRVASGY